MSTKGFQPMYGTKIKTHGLFSPSKPQPKNMPSSSGEAYYRKHPDEDHLDHVHRLIKMGFRSETIERHTGIPAESVRYVMLRNNYFVK
jgi:hypothetical protein